MCTGVQGWCKGVLKFSIKSLSFGLYLPDKMSITNFLVTKIHSYPAKSRCGHWTMHPVCTLISWVYSLMDLNLSFGLVPSFLLYNILWQHHSCWMRQILLLTWNKRHIVFCQIELWWSLGITVMLAFVDYNLVCRSKWPETIVSLTDIKWPSIEHYL
jgi:hypothetical protein